MRDPDFDRMQRRYDNAEEPDNDRPAREPEEPEEPDPERPRGRLESLLARYDL